MTMANFAFPRILSFYLKLGFNIWNVIFDFSGGLLSLIQLYFDCLDMNDFGGIKGNWAKLVLSLITLVFDVSCTSTVLHY